MVRVQKLFRIPQFKAIRDLPKPYIDYMEDFLAPAERVHDDPPKTKYLDYNQDHETGFVYRVPDQPVIVTYPENSKMGLWGGLGAVEGTFKPKRNRPRMPRIWHPKIEKHTFYSEILDVHINIEVTERTLELIDKNQGFDFYLLNTRIKDLHSDLGRLLKHKMLVTLAKETRELIREKYKDHIRPLEEVEWHGLMPFEAITKAKLMRMEETIEPPLKVTFARELIERLKAENANVVEIK